MQILGRKNVKKTGKTSFFVGGGSQGHLRAQDWKM